MSAYGCSTCACETHLRLLLEALQQEVPESLGHAVWQGRVVILHDLVQRRHLRLGTEAKTKRFPSSEDGQALNAGDGSTTACGILTR